MSFPFPAEGLQVGAPEYVHPNGNDSRHIVPFPSLERRKNLRTPDQSSDLDSLLLEITNMPNITGAAIALDIGNCFECQASRGQSAPPCGTLCYPGAGLTGACLAMGEIQVCNNTEDDSRVDRLACQHGWPCVGHSQPWRKRESSTIVAENAPLGSQRLTEK